MIEVNGLSYSYNSRKASDSNQLSFPDFRVDKGGHFLLLGESGSGKTTLLHLLGGLLRPSKGKIEVDNIDISQLSETQLDGFRGRNFGFVFQKNHLISSLTVKKNLLMASFLAGVYQDEDRIENVLNQLGLQGKADSKIQELSQGQAQRVAIARAIINKPAIILADEPTSALDDKNCGRVIELLNSVAVENNAALIVATHDQRLKKEMNSQIIL
jgi:ABC-type lipoprotein export system ATPase subunit